MQASTVLFYNDDPVLMVRILRKVGQAITKILESLDSERIDGGDWRDSRICNDNNNNKSRSDSLISNLSDFRQISSLNNKMTSLYYCHRS